MIHFTRMVLAIKWKIAKIFWRLLNGVQLFLVLQQSEETGRASCRLLKNCSDSETTMKSTNAQCAVFTACLPSTRTSSDISHFFVLIYHLTEICPSLFDWKAVRKPWIPNSKFGRGRVLATCCCEEEKLFLRIIDCKYLKDIISSFDDTSLVA